MFVTGEPFVPFPKSWIARLRDELFPEGWTIVRGDDNCEIYAGGVEIANFGSFLRQKSNGYYGDHSGFLVKTWNSEAIERFTEVLEHVHARIVKDFEAERIAQFEARKIEEIRVADAILNKEKA